MFNASDDWKSELAAASESLRHAELQPVDAAGDVTSGDMFHFDVAADNGIEWVVVKQHVDDPELWFVVPFDQHFLVGTWDVFVAEVSSAGEGALRCGRGLWVHSTDFTQGTRDGGIEAGYVREACQRLAAMVEDGDVSCFRRPDVDVDPDYLEWMEEVTAASEQLETLLQTSSSNGSDGTTSDVIRLADFSTAWASAPGLRHAPQALAADDGGLGAGPSKPVEPLSAAILAKELPGQLVAVQESKGLRLQYHPQAEELLEVSIGEVVVEWAPLPGGAFQSREVYSLDKELAVKVDGRTILVIQAGGV